MSPLKRLKNAQRHQKLRTGIVCVEVCRAHNHDSKRVIESTASELSKEKIARLILWAMKSRIIVAEAHTTAEQLVRKIREQALSGEKVAGVQTVVGFNSSTTLRYQEK